MAEFNISTHEFSCSILWLIAILFLLFLSKISKTRNAKNNTGKNISNV